MPLRATPGSTLCPYLQRAPTVQAGDRTCGTYFVVVAPYSVIWGARCYSAIAAGSLKFSLWEPGGALISSVTVLLAGAGVYEGEFPVKVTLDPTNFIKQDCGAIAGMYCVSVWETTGTSYTKEASGPGRSMGNRLQGSAWTGAQTAAANGRDSYYSAGDAIPVAGVGVAERYLIDPIVYGWAEEINPAKNLVVPRLPDKPDGPFRGVEAGDIPYAPYLSFSVFTVDTQPTGVDEGGAVAVGGVSYISDGDGGDPCIAVHDGTSWKRVALGAEIAGV